MGNKIVIRCLEAIGEDDEKCLESEMKAIPWKEAAEFLHSRVKGTKWKHLWRNHNFEWDRSMDYELCGETILTVHAKCSNPGFLFLSPVNSL